MKLPDTPVHPEPHTYFWTERELRVIQAYGIACARSALEEAARVCKSWGGVSAYVAETISAIKIEGEKG